MIMGMVEERIKSIARLIFKGLEAALFGLFVNIYTGFYRLFFRQKVVAFHISTASQFCHIETICLALSLEYRNSITLVLLTDRAEICALRCVLDNLNIKALVSSVRATRALIFLDILISVDQGAQFPLVRRTRNVCMFHGQPSKGNVYQRYNYRQIQHLVFYGPLMKEHYFEQKAKRPEWPSVQTFDIGQPSSDKLFTERVEKSSARARLGLPDRTTVMYAPSFESCSSLATHGAEIIDSLLALNYNVIFKPHPGFFRRRSFGDPFNSGAPDVYVWQKKLFGLESFDGFLLLTPDSSVSSVCFFASDVLLTDYSGIAFDAINLDIGVIFWDCPDFFNRYLPERYGICPEIALTSLACNVGRSAGVVVKDLAALRVAISEYRQSAAFKSKERAEVAGKLLFNKATATRKMITMILDMLEERNV